MSGDKIFWTEFLELYKELPALWRIKSSEYRNRVMKMEGYKKLINKLQEKYSDSNREMVVKKINTFRSTYRKELKKVKRREKSGAGTTCNYKPSLWFYHLLSFLEDQDASAQITCTMDDATQEETRAKTSGTSEKPKKRIISEEDTFIKIACEHLQSQNTNSSVNSSDPDDKVAKLWAAQLKEMQPDQRVLAHKIISDVLFQGGIGNLDRSHVQDFPNFFQSRQSSTTSYLSTPSPVLPAARGNTKFTIKGNKREMDIEELIRLVYSRPVLWDQRNINYYNVALVEENWQSVAEALKQPTELCKKKWQNTCEQFGNELKKIPISLSQQAELSKEQYDPYTAWPYFKSLLFLTNHMKSRTPAGYCNLAENFVDISNEVHLDDSFSKSYEDIPEIEEAVARPVTKTTKSNSYCVAEILAIEQRKLELLKNKVSIQKEQRDDDNEFFHCLIPYMKTMDIHQKLLCRMKIQRTVYNYAFPAATIMPDAAQNSTIQMDCFAEDSKMNIIDITEESKNL